MNVHGNRVLLLLLLLFPFFSRAENENRKNGRAKRGEGETRKEKESLNSCRGRKERERVYVNLITLIWRGCGASCRTVYMCSLCIMHAYCVHLLPQIKVRLSCGNLMLHNCALNATTTSSGFERRQKTKKEKSGRGEETQRERERWIKKKKNRKIAAARALSCSHAILMRLIFINASAQAH